MLYSETCKTGTLQVDETTVQIVAPFKKLLWAIPRASVTSIDQRKGVMAVDLTIHSTEGDYPVQMLTKQNAEKFLALFPEIAVGTALPTGKQWYYDPSRLTYVATYTSEKEAQKELEAAAQHGWMPQDTAATAGHINVGRTAAKVALLGPISLVTGASRSKDKITITFVRTPQWQAQHAQR